MKTLRDWLREAFQIHLDLMAYERQLANVRQQEEERSKAIKVEYPVGTTLYSFDLDEGIDVHRVEGLKVLISEFRDEYWHRREDAEILSDTVEGAIEKAIRKKLFKADGYAQEYQTALKQEKVDGLLQNFRVEVNFFDERAAQCRKAIEILEEIRENQRKTHE